MTELSPRSQSSPHPASREGKKNGLIARPYSGFAIFFDDAWSLCRLNGRLCSSLALATCAGLVLGLGQSCAQAQTRPQPPMPAPVPTPMQTPASTAAGWSVPQLMQLLAHHPTGRASFTETKRLALLDAPVISSGELLYQPPDRLEKHTWKPVAESLLIQGQRLTIVQGNQRREVDLAQYPQALAFVQALHGTLVGDLQLLQSHYQMTLTGNESAWQLKLTPLDDAMLRWVQHVTVKGAHNVVTSVLTQQADGDSSLVTIHPASPAAPAPVPQAGRPARH